MSHPERRPTPGTFRIEAVPWMAKHTRNPWPKRVVWVQDDVTHDRFYWLEVPAGSVKTGQKIVATVDANTISLEGEVSDTISEVFSGMVPRSAATILKNLRRLPDAARCGYAVLEVGRK